MVRKIHILFLPDGIEKDSDEAIEYDENRIISEEESEWLERRNYLNCDLVNK